MAEVKRMSNRNGMNLSEKKRMGTRKGRKSADVKS